MKELHSILAHLLQPDFRRATLATLVQVAGSSYRRPGARLLVTADGARIGSISGGCLEEDVVARAAAVARSGIPDLVTYDTTSENDFVWGVGLGCHGVVRVLIENVTRDSRWPSVVHRSLQTGRATTLEVIWSSAPPHLLGTHLAGELMPPSQATVFSQEIQPPLPVIIFGAGDDAQPLARFAKELGWRVTIADPRRGFATPERFPSADAHVVAPATELVARAAPPAGSVVVVMTHHYVHDVPILRDLLTNESLRYVGLLGPKKRAERILADLAEDGVSISSAARERLHAPVGLDLGAETPEEVALSIIAEIRAVLANRDARPLRERTRPIHT